MPPDQTAVPAVWPEYSSSYTAPGRRSAVSINVVAAIAAQVHTAEYAAIADAHDRLDTLTPGDLPGCQITSRAGALATVDIGAVTHTALVVHRHRRPTASLLRRKPHVPIPAHPARHHDQIRRHASRRSPPRPKYKCQVTHASVSIRCWPTTRHRRPGASAEVQQLKVPVAWQLNLTWLQDWNAPAGAGVGGGLANYANVHAGQIKYFEYHPTTDALLKVTGTVEVAPVGFAGDMGVVALAGPVAWQVQGCADVRRAAGRRARR